MIIIRIHTTRCKKVPTTVCARLKVGKKLNARVKMMKNEKQFRIAE